MILANKIRLEPTVAQTERLYQHAGTARFVYNWALAENNRQYDLGLKPNIGEIKKQFNAVKYIQFSWLKNIARDAHSQPFYDLRDAFKNFFEKRSGRPKFKSKHKSKDSFYLANDQFKIIGNRIRLPRIGWVKLSQELRFTGHILSARVSRTADQWFISISVEMKDYSKPRISDHQVGIDLGVAALAATSDGQFFYNKNPLRSALKKLKRLQQSLSRKVKKSKNWQKAKAKVAKLYARIACIRKDHLHKVTTKIARENQTVVLEDLNVNGMMQNRRSSRMVSDVGMYEFRRQLEYKSKIYDSRLLFVSRWFPSSKKCSKCGNVKKELKLSERDYNCSICGETTDRDLNASINILTAGLAGLACGPESSGVSSEATNTKLCRDEARTKPEMCESS